MKILIVDDDDISLTLMSKILQKGGYQTVAASGAKKALEYLESGEAIMLMILDVMMPEMNGLEFLEHIHTRPGLSDIPVIICSGDRLRDSVVRSIKMGVSDYILKPIDAYVLLEKVGKVIRTVGLPLIDKERIISRLKIEPESYDEMMNTLIQNISTVMGEAPSLITGEKYDDLRFLLGRLQGGAISLGAGRLSDVLTRIGDSLQGKEADRINNMLIALQREFNILCDIVKHSKAFEAMITGENDLNQADKGPTSILSSMEQAALRKTV